MPLNKCPSCGGTVSSQAAACPKCGHQFKSAGGVNLRDPVHVVGLVLAVLMGLGILAYAIMILS